MIIVKKSRSIEDKRTKVGVDIAKSIFYVHYVYRSSEIQWKGKYSRSKWLAMICKKMLLDVKLAMEARGSSNYRRHGLQKLSSKVKITHAQFVKPYVKSNKNNAVDA